MTYVRELSDQELIDNYTNSYSHGAKDFSNELWPDTVDGAASEAIGEYNAENFSEQIRKH